MRIGDNFAASFEYAKDALIGKWIRWILLIVISIIPVVDFILVGYNVRVLRGTTPAPELEDYGQLIIDGLLYTVISAIWAIPAIIVGIILIGGPFIELIFSPDKIAAIAEMIVGSLVTFTIAFVFGLFATIGLVRFARMEKFSEAFAFGAIRDKIGDIGWINYIIALLVINIVVEITTSIILFIPIVWPILLVIALPFLSIFTSRFICNLYDSAEKS